MLLILQCLGLKADKAKEGFSFQDAQEYYEHSPRQFRFDASCKALDLFTFNGNERVLEIGCGPGVMTEVISKKVPQGSVVGIDMSEGMIDYARQMAEKNHLTSVDFAVGNAQELPFCEEFDAICSFTAFHWIRNKQKTFEGMYKSLKKGGRIFILVPLPEPYTVLKWFDNVINSEKWNCFFKEGYLVHPAAYNSADEYEKLLEAAGFSSFSVLEKEFFYTHLSEQDLYYSFFYTVSPLRRKVALHLQTFFIQDVVQEVLKDFPLRKDGSIEVMSRVLCITAQKI